jgi:hypothetical protein
LLAKFEAMEVQFIESVEYKRCIGVGDNHQPSVILEGVQVILYVEFHFTLVQEAGKVIVQADTIGQSLSTTKVELTVEL